MTSRSRRILAYALVMLATAAVPAAAQDEAKAAEEKATLTFTFKRASVQAFMGYLSREGGFTFVEESAVQGDITAVAEKPLTRTQALEVLRAWLLPKDRTLLRTGDVVRILSLEEAKRRGLPVRIGANPKEINDNDELVTQVMPLRYVQASEVKSQLEGLLSDQGVLMIEGTSNALVVRDTSASIRRFAEVLQALDQSVSSELEVKVYRLVNADAAEVSKIVGELFAGQAGGVAGGTRSTGGSSGRSGGRSGRSGRGGMRDMARMFFSGGGGSGGSAGGGAGSQAVNASTDPRTNSVVVTATKDQLRLIDALITQLDEDPDPIVTEIRPFPLENADAASLAETLTVLFDESNTNTQQQRGGGGTQGMPRWVRRMVGGNAGGQATTSSSDRYSPTPKFTTDERTNTLIVSATVSDLDMIGSLIKTLDLDPTEATAVLVTPLRNASAENLAQILTDSLSDSPAQSAGGGGRNTQGRNTQGRNTQGRNTQGRNTQAGGRQASSGGSMGGLVGDVTVVADAEANALVFTTSQRNFDRIRAVVRELDRPRRQVFIECLIAEVRLTDKGELGVQWDALFTNDILNEKDGTQSVGTDFGLGSLNDGVRYTTSSDKLTGFLRALQTDGRLNILSSPKILCLENQDAEISVGQEVPFVTNSRITQNGDTVNTIQYRDVGIILRVTPQVNEDGHVKMVIHPEVSSIAPASESVQISEGVRSPTFNRNFADTTIVVADSETAVIGGLISNSIVETEFSIPLLGNIPILGRLFGSTIKEKVKQEIVVFLTPHVVESAGELRARTNKTLGEFAMVPVEVVREELDRWLRGMEMETHPYHYNRGTVLLEGGRVPEAIDDLRKAISFKGGDPSAHFNLGLALARAGRLEEAKAELRVAALLAPGDAEIPYNMAAVYWRQDDYPLAAAKFQRTLELDPLHEQAREWLPRSLRELRRIEGELLKEKSE